MPVTSYRRVQVESATPGRRIVMLYDRLLRDLEQAKLAIGENPADVAAWSDHVTHAHEVVTALYAFLDFDADDPGVRALVTRLAGLYDYYAQQILGVLRSRDAQALDDLTVPIKDLRDAWHMASLQEMEG